MVAIGTITAYDEGPFGTEIHCGASCAPWLVVEPYPVHRSGHEQWLRPQIFAATVDGYDRTTSVQWQAR